VLVSLGPGLTGRVPVALMLVLVTLAGIVIDGTGQQLAGHRHFQGSTITGRKGSNTW
jgi:hypothetical protein